MSTRTLLQYAGMAFVAAMVMGIQIDDGSSAIKPTQIAAEPPASSRSAAPLAPSGKTATPSQSQREYEQHPAAPGQEAMELRVPLARGVVQA